MSSARRAAHAAPVAAAAVALVAAACGGLGETSPEERLAASADATREAGSAAFDLEMRMKLGREGAGMDMTMSGGGVVDLESRTGRLELKSPGLGASVTTVFDADVAYTRVPAFMTGGEARWVRREGRGRMARAAGGVGSNPLSTLDAVRDVQGEIRALGADTVRGADVQGYGVTLAGSKLWGEGEEVPESLRQLEIPSEIWLDAENRVRRTVMEIELGPVMKAVQEQATADMSEEEARGLGQMLGGMEGTMTVTTVLHDFGTAVEVTMPDSADVVDREVLQRQMRQRGGGDGGGSRDSAAAAGGG